MKKWLSDDMNKIFLKFLIGCIVFAVIVIYAGTTDMRESRAEEEELVELRKEVKSLENENWNLKDANWILNNELTKMTAELRYLNKQVEGKE